MKFIAATITATLIVSLLGTPGVFAAEKLQEAVTKVEDSVDKLIDVKDTDEELSEEEKTTQDLEARFEILNKVLELSLKEITNLKERLSSFDKLSGEEKAIKEAALEVLNDYEARYKAVAGQINDQLSLEEVKNIAKELRNWREEVYNPEVQKIVDFTIVIQNRGFLETAHTRLEKIINDITKLEKAGFIEVGIFDRLLIEASQNLETAKESNLEANKLVFASITPPKIEIPETSSDSEDNASEEVVKEDEVTEIVEEVAEEDQKVTEIEEKPQPQVKDLVEESLSKVKNTYTIFIEISTRVKKILRIN